MTGARAHFLRRVLGLALLAPAAFASQAAKLQDAAAVEWDDWHVLAGIDQPGGAAKVAEPRLVEEELPKHLLGKEGPDLARIYPAKGGGAAEWKPLDESAWVGQIPELAQLDLVKCAPPGVPTKDVAAYLYRRVRARAPVTVVLRYGCDDAARIWLNGKLVSESTLVGPLEPLGDKVSLELGAGDNHLLVKVVNGDGAWRFRMLPFETRPLAGRAAAQLKINHAIDRGCQYLIGQQLRDGSWGFEDARFPGGQTALSVYALVKSGISPRHQAVQRGVAYLKARPALHTYTAGCTLLALWALHDPANEEWIADLADELSSWQTSGMWAYPEGDVDLSNTQYAVLGLLAASRSGVKVPQKIWRDVASQVLNFQGRSGGFGYHIGDALIPTGSMTAAGVSVLSIAKEQLNARDSGIDNSIAAGARWLGERFTVTGSPQSDPKARPDAHWGPYYLYGVERACTLLGQERLGGTDWYWEGAAWFLDAQGAKGEFPTAWADNEPNTCFGLLFLGRATASFTGQGAEHKDSLYRTDDAKSDVWVRAAGDASLSLWIAGFSKRALLDYGWKAPESKGVHVAKVEYLIDGAVVATLPGNASRAWNGDKFALQRKFDAAGKRAVVARVSLMLEPEEQGGDPGTFELESAPFDVQVTELASPFLLAQAAAGSRNLVRAAETKVVASTQTTDSPATAAIDGRESTAWTCTPEDAAPWITLEFEKPLRVNTLLLSGLGGRPDSAGEWDRATKVELRVNKADPPIPVALEQDELRSTQFELGRQTAIRTLEIRIVERVAGTKFPGRAGFDEIALWYQPPGKK